MLANDEKIMQRRKGKNQQPACRKTTAEDVLLYNRTRGSQYGVYQAKNDATNFSEEIPADYLVNIFPLKILTKWSFALLVILQCDISVCRERAR